MKTNTTIKLNPSLVTGRLGLCAAALAGTAAAVPSADATVITNNTQYVVTNTFAGIYLNFVTGVAGATPAGSPGWDFNPYAATGGNLQFFWPTAPASSFGGVSSAGVYSNLSAGAVVSAGSTFITTATATSPNFNVAGTHILGFRFFNEATSAINFGYLTIVSGGAGGFPATITSYSYENSGAAITVVPEPSSAALLSLAALALGAVGVRQWRRRVAA